MGPLGGGHGPHWPSSRACVRVWGGEGPSMRLTGDTSEDTGACGQPDGDSGEGNASGGSSPGVSGEDTGVAGGLTGASGWDTGATGGRTSATVWLTGAIGRAIRATAYGQYTLNDTAQSTDFTPGMVMRALSIRQPDAEQS
jgi:hypothetical protein